MENFAPYVQHISSYFSSNAVGVPCKIRGKFRSKALRGKEFPQKKVLSLVLCVAVMLSVMVMGAGAAFSDQDKIENTEAVNMCTALNIIGGYEDGSYHPERNIERSEITKMICVALNGGKEPNLAVPATPTFSDVRGSADAWAEKYIESCAAQGIVSGVGGGRFSPAGNVTGSQLAKMLLVALGYRADEANFTGNGWDTNVNVIATQKGLYEGLENMDVSAALTRDNAAQMIWNALQAVEVEYTYTLVTENGQLVSKVVVQDKAPATVGSNKYDYTLLYDKYKAVMTNDADTYDTLTMTKYKWNDKNGEYDYTFTDNKSKEHTFSSAADYTSLFAQQVNVVYKNTTDEPVYGIYAEDSQVLYEGIAGDIEDNDQDSIKIDGVKYKVDDDKGLAGVEYYAENVYTPAGDSDDAQDYYTVRVIDLDGDDEVDCVVYLPFTVAEVTYVGSKYIQASGKYEFEDCNIYDGIAKDDYAVIVSGTNTADGKDTLTKAEVVSGEVTVVNGDDYTIDGEVYTLAKDVSKTNLELGNNVEAVVVNGYIFAAELVSGSISMDDVVYINGTEVKTSYGKTTLMAKAVFANGETTEIEIKSVEGVNDDNLYETNDEKNTAKNVSDGLWAFEMDGDKYELKTISVGDDANFDTTTNNTTVGDDRIGGLRVNDNAVVFVKDGEGDVTVLTGADVKAWSEAARESVVAYANNTSGYAYVELAAITVEGDVPGSAYSDIYGYVVKTLGETQEDNTKYTSFLVWTGAENETIKVKTSNVNGDIEKGSFVKVSGDEISALNLATSAAAVAATDEETVSFIGNSTEYKITSDTKVIYVDTEAVAGEEGGSIAEATDHNQDGSFEKNVVYVVDTDNKDELLVLFVDTNNELKGTEPVVKTTVSAEGVLTVDEVLPTTSSTIYPVAENVEELTSENIGNVNGGLFSGFDLDSLKGKAATTVTVKIPVSGEKVAIRQTNKALAGASTDGRVENNVKVAGYTNIKGGILELSVVVMQGENVKLEVVSNAEGTYGDTFSSNNSAFETEEGAVVYTINTSGISFAK